AILMEPYKSERFVRLHAVQALGLYVVMIALLVLNVIPILGQIIWFLGSFAVFVFAVMGAIKAFQGEMWEMPVVYGLVKQFI
ncbi:MAG: hypothetical protein Q8M55_03845, partial [Actinomycetota bacterium]|nr:hypothetical protein [Actinomycetota bacterium]